MIINLKTKEEIEFMRKAGSILRETKEYIKTIIKPGISTEEIDKQAEEFICVRGADPAFKGYKGFPSTLCISVNHQLIHGIPSANTILKEGDIVSIDMGCIYKGYYSDTAITLPVGKISEQATNLLKVTNESLYKGIEQMVEGNYVGDISNAIQNHIESNKYYVVRNFTGHGIGTNLHEEPQVLNYGEPKTGLKLREGLVLALEPMVTLYEVGTPVLSDGWTIVTEDGSLCAHFEHTIAITENGPEILT